MSSSKRPANLGPSIKPIRTAYADYPKAPPGGSREASETDSQVDAPDSEAGAHPTREAPEIEEPLVYPAFEGTQCMNCDGFDDPFLDEPRAEVAKGTPLTEMPYFCGQCRVALLNVAGWDFAFTMRQLLFHLRNESFHFQYWFRNLEMGFSADGKLSDRFLKEALPEAIASRQSLVDRLRKRYANKKPGKKAKIPQEVLGIKANIRARLKEANILHDLGQREFHDLANDQYELEFEQKQMMLYPSKHYSESEWSEELDSW